MAWLAVPRAVRADTGVSVATAENDRPLVMRRFMVSASRIGRNPWRYAQVDGFEVLSRASATATNWVLDSIRLGRALENAVIPKDWLRDSAVPDTVIIDDTDLNAVPMSQRRSEPMVFRPVGDAIAWGRFAKKGRNWSDQFRAWDDDTSAVNVDVYGTNTEGTFACTTSLTRLARVVPALPRWVVGGLLGPKYGVFRDGFMPVGGRSMAGPGAVWVSLDESERLVARIKLDAQHPDRPPALKIEIPPLCEVFAEAPPPPEKAALIESAAGLFVRWGLLGDGTTGPEMPGAFQELVRRGRRMPVTEKMFTECFGFGFPEMERRLEAYLRRVLLQPTLVNLREAPFTARAELRPATSDQIGRIIGDWLRMAAVWLRRDEPELCGEFLDSARQVLERAYRDDDGLPPDVDPSAHGSESPARQVRNAGRGPVTLMKPLVVSASKIHDSRLLAVYGLYEFEAGDEPKAAELLEAVVRKGVERPQAYVALAKIRYTQAMARPSGTEGRLDGKQAAAILGPLQAALRYPPSVDVYRLIVGTWVHCEDTPPIDEIDEFIRGAALFPRDASLAFSAALVCARSGYASKAERLTDESLPLVTSESARKDFERLRSAVMAAAASPDQRQERRATGP